MNFNLELTKAFIKGDPTSLTFQHFEKVSDGAGGWTLQAAGEDDYTIRLIPQADKVPVSSSIDGEREAVEYVILGLPDMNIQKNDLFSWGGVTWKVTYQHRKPHYAGKWDVIKYEH